MSGVTKAALRAQLSRAQQERDTWEAEARRNRQLLYKHADKWDEERVRRSQREQQFATARVTIRRDLIWLRVYLRAHGPVGPKNDAMLEHVASALAALDLDTERAAAAAA